MRRSSALFPEIEREGAKDRIDKDRFITTGFFERAESCPRSPTLLGLSTATRLSFEGLAGNERRCSFTICARPAAGQAEVFPPSRA